MATPMVKHVVIDSGPFIANAPLREIGENFHTLHDVVKEIRDKATRHRLQVLPYTLNFREPSTEAISFVTEFSKQTGDYASLSAVDLRVLALTYQLEKEHVGTEHIKTKPDRQITFETTKRTFENPTSIAGFYIGKKTKETPSETTPSKTTPSETTPSETTPSETTPSETKPSETTPSEIPSTQRFAQEGQVLSSNLLEVGEDSEEDEDSEDDDDDGGWITPGNIKEVRESMGDKNTEKANVDVGCCTGDFAMQNVLIQMGLNVISYNGMLIKRAKSYVLRCHACFKITTNMMREFCHNCGNKTLQKVSMSVDEDGKVRYHLSTRKQFNTRGLKYSLPMPKGGKHAKNPILCADQKEAQHRTAKASKVKYNVMDPDYIAGSSPFAPTDITSRSAQLGVRNNKGSSFQKRRNPNESRGRRK